jgi:hypothetical protein
MTRVELSRHALCQALHKVHAGQQKLKPDEETRGKLLAKDAPHDAASGESEAATP